MSTGGVYNHISLYTPPVVHASAYIHHHRPFASHTTDGPETSWGMSVWDRALMETIVEPKRSSLPRDIGPLLCDMQRGCVYSHIPSCTSPVTYTGPYIHHWHSFIAQISDENGNSRSMLAFSRSVMEAIVQPKRASIPGAMCPPKTLWKLDRLCT